MEENNLIMKRSTNSPIVWAALTALGVFCYLYLHNAAVEEYGTCPSSISIVEHPNQNGVTPQESDIIFLDIALAKKILNFTKIVIPPN